VAEDQPLTPEELKEFQQREEKLKSFIVNMRLESTKLNREILRYTIAIDEVPGTAELLQYEKRFIELYNQGNFLNIPTKPVAFYFGINIDRYRYGQQYITIYKCSLILALIPL
jgi:hypothetical protein